MQHPLKERIIMFARTQQGMFSAARNSVCSTKLLALPRGVSLSSEVGQPIHTCRKHQVIIICQTPKITKMNNKKSKGGRRVVERQRKKPKLDPAINRYSVNFSNEKDMRFLKMFDRSCMTSKSAFIKARIFGEPFHVVTFDKSQQEYYAKLNDFHAQFRMVGNNYNQTLKELKCHFSEHRAMALVCKLEKYMMQLVQIMHKVVELTIRYENHRIGKDN